MNPFKGLIHSNSYISLAAVSLTVETQIQLGLVPQWHPYLLLIFFATLFEYNLHRLITVLTNQEALNSEKHRWVRENLNAFYILVSLSVVGFAVVAFFAKKEVLLTFAPIAFLTLFYSIPVSGNKKHLFRLREIPFLKIFLIATVWSASTILLPVVQSEESFEKVHLAAMFMERFLFIFAVTIPFDIRDMDADRKAGLKTIPLAIHEKNAMNLSYLALLSFFLISVIHYQYRNEWYISGAIGLSALTSFAFLKLQYFRKMPLYHYGILDGTLLLQGILVMTFYFFTRN